MAMLPRLTAVPRVTCCNMGFIVVTISFLNFKVPAALGDYLVGAATGWQSAGIVAPILQRVETEH
jgi:hypothetical protein